MKVTALISVTLAAAVGLGCAALSVESVESASTEGAVDSEWVKPPFTASPLAPLANTYWKLTTLYGVPVIMGEFQRREAYLQFREDTQSARGFAGCNDFSGTYEVIEDALSLGPMAATRKLCADVMSTEMQFLAALEQATTFAIVGEGLILSDELGVTTAEFMAVYF